MRSCCLLGNRAWLIAFYAVCITAKSMASDEPTTRPHVLPLVVGAKESPSFVVDGIVRTGHGSGLIFQFAADGDRQRCAVLDASDQTPIFLSNEHEALIYDLENARLVRIADSRAYVRVDWQANDPKPLNVSMGVQQGKPEGLDRFNSEFRIDRFVRASAERLRPLDSPSGKLVAAERADGTVEAVQLFSKAEFRFTSLRRGEKEYALELNARGIGKPVPAKELMYPDLKPLSADLRVYEPAAAERQQFAEQLRTGRAFMAKLALASGPDMQERAGAFIKPDWDALRVRDKELGEKYRPALAKQGIEIAAPKRAASD